MEPTMEAPATPAGLMSKRAAIAYLGGISERKLFSLTQSGQVASVRIGRRVLFRQRDLDRFIEKCITRKAG